jgi:D-alanyl-D-alanine carboxypeptidase
MTDATPPVTGYAAAMSNRADMPPRTADPRAVIAAAHALGVPRDYGRRRGLCRVSEPRRLVYIGDDVARRPQWLAPPAARAWSRLREAAAGDGIALQVVSAFRSIEYQLTILRRKLERGQALDEILRVSAAPGYSEHHTGRALDLTTPGFAALEESFEGSAAFAWLRDNAARFDFHLSFPRDNRHGIAYEPWHWCWQARGKRSSPR